MSYKNRGADLLVRCLEAADVRYVFGIPVEENLDLLDALHDNPIRFTTTRRLHKESHQINDLARLFERISKYAIRNDRSSTLTCHRPRSTDTTRLNSASQETSATVSYALPRHWNRPIISGPQTGRKRCVTTCRRMSRR